MPVRKIPPKHRGLTGIASGNGGPAVSFESSLERDFVILVQGDPDTITIEEQPVSIPVPGKKGRAARYIPDFLVSKRSGPHALIEVKPSSVFKERRADFDDRFAAARQYAADRGWVFEIWTEKEIRGVRLDNLKFLRRFRREAVEPSLASALLEFLPTGNKTKTIADIVSSFGQDLETLGAAQRALWILIATGRLDADLDRELTPASTVRRPREESHGFTHAV